MRSPARPWIFEKVRRMTTFFAALTDVFEGIGRILDKLVVGLVKDDNDVVGHDRHKSVDLLLGDHRAGGVVGIRDENLAGARGDGRGHGVEIVVEGGVGDLDYAGIEKRGHEGVYREGVAGGDDLVAGTQKGVADEFDDSFEPLPRITFSR